MKKLYFLFITLAFIQLTPLLAQDVINLVNYGPEQEIKEGDDDFLQVIFIVVPAGESETIRVNMFDIDCGGKNDLAYGVLNSKFKFSLYGGTGAYTAGTIATHHPDSSDLYKGQLIRTVSVEIDTNYDNKWVNFAEVEPTQGELVNGSYYFKVLIEGIEGDDANVFNVKAEYTSSDRSIEMINYCPSFRLLPYSKPVQLRFDPISDDLTVHNFDNDGGRIKFVSPYRHNIRLTTSYEGKWSKDRVKLDEIEMGQTNAIGFGPGISKINDISFYVEDEKGHSQPFYLPITLPVKNNSPVIQKEVTELENCLTYSYDAQKSTDKENEEISYKWYIEDKLVSEESGFKHIFENPGTYNVMLALQDNSPAIESGTVERFKTKVNHPPEASAGEDIKTVPGKRIRLDAKNSKDPDGRITAYKWNLGDGNNSTSRSFNHSYSEPGTYEVELVVTDNSGTKCSTGSDKISVFVNSPPVADAGNDASGAANEAINFSGAGSRDTDGEIAEYHWDFGDGQNAEGKNVQHAFAKPGKYTVTLRVKDNTSLENNTAYDKMEVTINFPPVAVAGTDRLVAIDEQLSFDGSGSSDRDGNITEYNWDFGDGKTAKGINVNHSYAADGKYTVTLSVVDNSGTLSNTTSDELTVIVNSPPVANAGSDIFQTNPKVTFDASGSYDKDGTITSYSWDLGDGLTSTEKKLDHVYAEPGDYKVTLTVKDNTQTSNNTTSTTVGVRINAKPIADAGPDITVTPGEEFTLTGVNSVDLDGNITSYEWSVDKNQIGTDDTFQHKFDKPGYYNLNLKVSDDSKHQEAFDYDNIIVHVNASPVAVAGPDMHVAPGVPFKLDASKSYDVDGSISNYSWNVEEGKKLNDAEVEHNIKEPGLFNITLMVTDNSGAANSSASDELLVRVNSPPVPEIESEIFTCDKTVVLDASRSGDSDGDMLTYTWDFGDNSGKASGAYVIHSFEKSGIYPVILTVDDGNGLGNSVVTKSVKVSINSAPVAIAGEDETICSGELINLSASESYDADGDLLRYYWDFGDGTKTEGISTTKSYSDAGLYTLSLRVVDNSGLECNSSTDVKLIRVVESPVANAGPDLEGCIGSPIQFDGSLSTDSDGIVNSYFWDFGDGSTGGGVNTKHSYKNAGVYKVRLLISGELIGECENTDTDELIVTVVDAPSALFTSPDSVALGDSLKFDASASTAGGQYNLNYSWNFGDDSTASGAITEHVYASNGNYKVQLKINTDSNSECNESIFEKSIYVNAQPKASAGDDKVTSVNRLISFDASGSADQDGAISKYIWDFGDGNSGEGIQVQHNYAEAGEYNVELKVIDNTSLANNSDTDKMKVTVNAPPVSSISAPDYSYINQDMLFDASDSYDSDGNIAVYKWVLDGQLVGTGVKLNYNFKEPGLYNLSLITIDNSPMKDSASTSKTFRIYNIPEISLTEGKIICSGDELTVEADHNLLNTPAGLFYKWESPAGNTIGNESSLTLSAEKDATNSIAVSLADSNYKGILLNSAEYVIEYNTPPVAKAEADAQVYTGGANDKVVLRGTSSFDDDGDPLSYYWDLGDGNSASGSIVTHTYSKPGKYSVKLTVSDNKPCDCSTSEDVINIEVTGREKN